MKLYDNSSTKNFQDIIEGKQTTSVHRFSSCLQMTMAFNSSLDLTSIVLCLV